ncbi:PKD domain-containing protein [Desulfobulbus alkaliphilus]|uniref:PKD domain-containing protein n=1 Tax=Desulfobulbus alkaliphilus TaxID=869814 RepID=UPI001962C082|nr:PKD domain-containing protein [Desulfobulbus alkaliphilus]MBM9538468.1 PKD domain-containing protein [Desulfobulbus alkaliphilus]
MHFMIKRLLITLFCCLPTIAMAATNHSIQVEWGYTPPSQPAVTGYKLYQEGTLACQVHDPNATSMGCQVTLIKDTTNFTLTATFSDGTESPHSAPFPFSPSLTSPPPADDIIDPGTPLPSPTGSKMFSFTWDTTTDPSTLSGYRIYLNNTLLCATTNPADTAISCQADLLPGLMTFSMTQVSTSGVESQPSNLLVFDPFAYPELFNLQMVTFTWDYEATSNLAGFRLYQDTATPPFASTNTRTLLCATADPGARELGCIVDSPTGPVAYAMAAVHTDGSETLLSNILARTTGTSSGDDSAPAPETGTLQAVITATPTTGTAPLHVDFNAASSTGSIASSTWSFGDGATGTGSTAQHLYTAAGAYTATLTVTATNGLTSSATTTITVTEATNPEPAIPPTAVISSSTAAGPAPLNVSFDGSGSSAANGATIVSHSWSFGDGASATGATTGHTFTVAGTYSTTLTVIDSNGQTNSTSTPIVVTAAEADNIKPTAVAKATPTSGSAPLTVSFTGSGSYDSDGSIESYLWNFGDGTTATGANVTHTYTSEASFTATLQVTDDQGAKAGTALAITVQAEEEQAPLNMELGEISITTEWVRVPFDTTFTTPIVVAGPPSFNNAEPCVVRLRNVDATGFDIRLEEWDYLDNVHPPETVSYLVMEKGRHTLPNGATVEAGSFAGTTTFRTVSFQSAFAHTPVIMTTIASLNQDNTISGRVKNVQPTGFAYMFQEQEASANKHVNETVHFIAWEPGTGTMGTLQYHAATAKTVTDAWHTATYTTPFQHPPLLLADMQTANDTDPSALRVQNPTATGFQVRVQEEQSKNSDTSHLAETIGYLALGSIDGESELPATGEHLFTFTWDYDTTSKDVAGFRFYLNNQPLCATTDPTDRSIQCLATMLDGPMHFTMTAVSSTGVETIPSNLLSLDPSQFPQLSTARQATFTWDFDPARESTISGFEVLANGAAICQTENPSSRHITCKITQPKAPTTFTIQAMLKTGGTSAPSNTIPYTP